MISGITTPLSAASVSNVLLRPSVDFPERDVLTVHLLFFQSYLRVPAVPEAAREPLGKMAFHSALEADMVLFQSAALLFSRI